MSISTLQQKLGVVQDGQLGPSTLKAAMAYFKLTPVRTAHFFGQTSHETGGFKVFTENLNYSQDGLKKTFSKYFPGNLNELYARQPQKIANRVYASRMGNGDEKSGDGFKFRGRGALQTTGRDNYLALSKHLNKPEIMTNPDIVATQYPFEAAIYFFDSNKLWSICDQGITDASILALTKRINGGDNGLADRVAKTISFYNQIK